MTNEERQRLYEQYKEQQAQAEQAMIERHQLELLIRKRAAETQNILDTQPRQQYAAIVAVDLLGGFSAAGKIPWHYPADFKWFQARTKGHICVMGRVTYDDINQRLGDKAAESVLPGRKCFVVTSTPLPRENATAVASIGAIDKLLTEEDITRTVFFIGGESIYREGIAKCNAVYVTVVNKDAECDRFFPTEYLMKHFDVEKTLTHPSDNELSFMVWKRKTGT